MRNVKIKILNNLANNMAYGSSEAAGMDLVACIDNDVTIHPGETVLVPTGIKLAAEAAKENPFCYLLFGRSGLGINYGITLANSVGVIDSDFRGEVKAGLINHSNTPFVIHPGDRIAQLVLMPIERMNLIQSDELEETSRGTGGFGSTGI